MDLSSRNTHTHINLSLLRQHPPLHRERNTPHRPRRRRHSPQPVMHSPPSVTHKLSHLLATLYLKVSTPSPIATRPSTTNCPLCHPDTHHLVIQVLQARLHEVHHTADSTVRYLPPQEHLDLRRPLILRNEQTPVVILTPDLCLVHLPRPTISMITMSMALITLLMTKSLAMKIS